VKSWKKRYLRERARKIKLKIRRRFARCKITLMKIDYESKSIGIALKSESTRLYRGGGMWV
jgi:putative transposase